VYAVPVKPAYAIPSGKTLYGVLLDDVATGLVYPEMDASTFNPQEAADAITRTSFVDADPVVDHVRVGPQLTDMKHVISWASGPCSVNIPTVKEYFDTSATGTWPQQSV
jgi:hypothetical protein